jgi:hypothetical protein
MRRYVPAVVICVRCQKRVRGDEPYRMVDGQVRHAVDCLAPLARRKKASA